MNRVFLYIRFYGIVSRAKQKRRNQKNQAPPQPTVDVIVVSPHQILWEQMVGSCIRRRLR